MPFIFVLASFLASFLPSFLSVIYLMIWHIHNVTIPLQKGRTEGMNAEKGGEGKKERRKEGTNEGQRQKE